MTIFAFTTGNRPLSSRLVRLALWPTTTRHGWLEITDDKDPYMRKIVTGGVLMIGLLAGPATVSFASPPIQPTEHSATAFHAGNIEHADYYYHHHRYHHRTWDKRHRRWHYY